MDFSRHCNSTSHKEAVRHHEEQLMHNTIVEEDLHQSKETQKQQADEDQAKAKQLAKGKKEKQKRKYTEELVEINPGQTTREMEVKQKKQEDQVRVQQTDVEPPQEMTAVGAEEKSQEGGTTEEKQGPGTMRVDRPDQAGGTEGNSSQDSEIGDAIAAKLKKALLNVLNGGNSIQCSLITKSSCLCPLLYWGKGVYTIPTVQPAQKQSPCEVFSVCLLLL